MSYEGYVEFISETGLYWTIDAYDDWEKSNPEDGSKAAYRHSVDQTNGYERNNPATYPAKKIVIDTIDVWKKDHLGNKYAILVNKYAPDSKEWKVVI